MRYSFFKLSSLTIALGIGFVSHAWALDFAYHCDEVLYDAKTSINDYQVVVCASGKSINFNYGPVNRTSEVDALLSRDQVYYVPQVTEDGAATGKVGLKFNVGRYHYAIFDQVMTFQVGYDETDVEVIPLKKPTVDLNLAKLVKYKLKPE